ncbi:hypothetical protein FUAX_21570 [Fulvitalea axinellae]|uniref:Uncharacterized protein n=1 Tax=Fulvitalea axinellae TaxID=1182444 RepID=A0AAU9CK96_9BACT|nr:hypothetical protein FUAX_21570 [Fulvitalea axinellae]
MMREAVAHLRNEEYILIDAGAKTFLLGDIRIQSCYENAREKLGELIVHQEVLVPDVGWIQDYVTKMPDLAWDIIDFSEKPLSICLPGGRHVAEGLLENDGGLFVRVCKEKAIHKLIYNFGRGVFCLHLKASAKDVGVLTLDKKVLHLQASEIGFEPNPKRMSLGLEGEVKFWDA